MFLIRLCVGLLVCMLEKPLLLPFQCILCLVAAFQNRSLCTAFILVLLVRDYDSRKIIFIVGGTVNISLKYRNYWYRRYFWSIFITAASIAIVLVCWYHSESNCHRHRADTIFAPSGCFFATEEWQELLTTYAIQKHVFSITQFKK